MTTPRDNSRPDGYYSELVGRYQKSIANFRAMANATPPPAHRTRLLLSILHDELEAWIASYSAGASLESLKISFANVVDATVDYYAAPKREPVNFAYLTDYIWALWTVSIAILVEVDDAAFTKLVAAINQPRKDYVYDRLVRFRMPTLLVHRDAAQPKSYEKLRNALRTNDVAERSKLILEFIKKYYPSIKKTYFMDNDDPGRFGLWLFELAAVVKALGIDDAAFATDRHYPRDWVRGAE